MWSDDAWRDEVEGARRPPPPPLDEFGPPLTRYDCTLRGRRREPGWKAGKAVKKYHQHSNTFEDYSSVGFKNQIWRRANIFEHLLTRVHLPL